MKYKPLSEDDFSYLLSAADWLKTPGLREMTKVKIMSRCAALGIAPKTKMMHDTGYENRAERKLKVS